MNRLKLVNAIAEAVIPIMGLLFFDWGIYFILLFYFIDLVATEVFVYIKVAKIIDFQKIKFPFNTRYGRLLMNTFLMISLVFVSHLAVFLIVPEINFLHQVNEFLSYEEAGLPIAQGYILLPLVILGNYQQYNTLFVKTKQFQRISWKVLIFSRRKALYIALIGGVAAIIIGYFTNLPAFVYIAGVIVVKFYIDLYHTNH